MKRDPLVKIGENPVRIFFRLLIIKVIVMESDFISKAGKSKIKTNTLIILYVKDNRKTD